MILNNFRLYSLCAPTTYQIDKRNDLSFVTYDGETRYIWDNRTYPMEKEGCYQSCHHLFTGGQKARLAWVMGIMDFQTEEEMIASKNFYNYGTRTSTASRDENIGTSGMIILGSGDTPPTKEDYKLDSWIPTIDLKPIAFGTTSPKKYEDDFIGGFWATYYNVSEENKTVKEVGIISSFYKTIQWDDPAQTKILMAREVLENPVIIKPHEGCTFSFVIK
jgi:hypothetical protein